LYVPFLGFGNLCIYLSLDFGGFRSGEEKQIVGTGEELGREMERRVTNENHDEECRGHEWDGDMYGQ
jgi:hypothetical protein